MCAFMDLSKAFGTIDHKRSSGGYAKLVQFQNPGVK